MSATARPRSNRSGSRQRPWHRREAFHRDLVAVRIGDIDLDRQRQRPRLAPWPQQNAARKAIAHRDPPLLEHALSRRLRYFTAVHDGEPIPDATRLVDRDVLIARIDRELRAPRRRFRTTVVSPPALAAASSSASFHAEGSELPEEPPRMLLPSPDVIELMPQPERLTHKPAASDTVAANRPLRPIEPLIMDCTKPVPSS